MDEQPQASITAHPEFLIGDIDPRIHGMFIEHLGRAIYGGIYEPGHPTADSDGFRGDVLELVRSLAVPIIRYPGGNFVSGYHWEDGIGPRDRRPRRLDLAWGSIESNHIGTNEFISWCRKAKAEPMMAVNLGERGMEAARNLVEYCNFPGGTAWSDLRRQHGFAEPHRIKTWCLGNEMDANWQIGHVSAASYGRIAREAGKVMKWTDPSIELVVCGSSSHSMGSFGDWERTVLEHCYAWVDYVSLHVYYGHANLDLGTFLAKSRDMEAMIIEVIATCDHVKAVQRQRKTINLCFDEWNVWYHQGAPNPLTPSFREAPPLLEDIYTLADALVVGCMVITLLRHCHRVRIACLAQLVNVIAPIMTENGGRSWRQTIWWPLAHAHRWASGMALDARVHSTRYDAPDAEAVPHLDAVITWDREGGQLCLFAVNRSQTQRLSLTADLRGFPGHRLIEHLVMSDTHPQQAIDADHADRVRPRAQPGGVLSNDRLHVLLPPLSWNVVRLGSPD